MPASSCDPRALWAELRLEVHRLQTVEVGSATFHRLLDSGVDESALREYIACGRGRKHPLAAPVPDPASSPLVASLLSSGGSISGGHAVRSWTFSTSPDRDVDVFFGDFPSFVSAHLAAYRVKNVDVCLYRHEPWELFDLDASCVSLSRTGFSFAPEFSEAFETGVCGVRMNRIVDPVATLRRIAKYGSSYGLRFRTPEVLWLAVASRAPDDVVRDALALCLA